MSIEISAQETGYRSEKPWWYGEGLSALLLGVLSMVAGLVVAVVWRAVAPMVQGVVSISDGQKSAYYEDPETKGFVGQDGTFGICAAVAAVILALLAFAWFRKRGPVGAAWRSAGPASARRTSRPGSAPGSAPATARSSPPRRTWATTRMFNLPLQLSATGVIWLWPAIAVGLYFLLMLVFGPNDPETDQEFPEFPQWADPVDLTAPGPLPGQPGQGSEDARS
jgi:hypothetical protein